MPKSIYSFSHITHFDAQKKLINKLIHWCNPVIEYDGNDNSDRFSGDPERKFTSYGVYLVCQHLSTFHLEKKDCHITYLDIEDFREYYV